MQETETLFECKENITLKATAKSTLHFHQKVSQKHTKIKIQSLEQGLPGTTQMKLLIGGFEAKQLLAHWIQAVAPCTANWTQEVAPILSNITCAVPCVNPKHQGE